MSITLNRSGSIEAPVSTTIDGTNPVAVHTASSKYVQIVEAIGITNTDSGAYVITLHWVDSTPTSYAFWKKSVAANTTEIIDSLPFLTSGLGTVRSITATSASDPNNNVTVTVITSAQGKTSAM